MSNNTAPQNGHHHGPAAAQGVEEHNRWQRVATFCYTEIRAVGNWSVLTLLWQAVLQGLSHVSTHNTGHTTNVLLRSLLHVLSWIALAIQWCLPGRGFSIAAGVQAGAFVPMLLQFDITPHLGIRLCEWRMHRTIKSFNNFSVALWWLQLPALLLIHLVVPSLVWSAWRRLVPTTWNIAWRDNEVMEARISDDSPASILCMLLFEVLTTVAFVVGFLVIPVLLRLNGWPLPWCGTTNLLYPLYTCTLVPAWLLLVPPPLTSTRCGLAVAHIMGGLAAGQVMALYFPDDEYGDKSL